MFKRYEIHHFDQTHCLGLIKDISTVLGHCFNYTSKTPEGRNATEGIPNREPTPKKSFFGRFES